MCDFITKEVKTDCTLISVYNGYFFIGIGCYLHIYDSTCRLLGKNRIFDHQRLFGLDFYENGANLLIIGENLIKKYQYNWRDSSLLEIASNNVKEWILTLRYLQDKLTLVTMQNNLLFLDNELITTEIVPCPQKCIAYSAYAFDHYNSIVVLTGTVFNEIIVWQKDLILFRLTGHKGVIFSLHYNEVNSILCSTSDDRTAILWNLDLKKTVKRIAVLKDHTARVFKCKVFDKYVVTCGEDSLVNIWSLDGRLLRRIEAHQGDTVWSVDGNEQENYLITGAGDGSVIKHAVKIDLNEIQLRLNEVPRRVALTKDGNVVVITIKGSLYYYMFANKEWSLITLHDELKKYALLEVSNCKQLISLSGYNGEIFIYKETNQILEFVLQTTIPQCSRIYSFHWLNCSTVLICSANGLLSLWTLELKKGIMSLESFYILPPSSERWTTCACVIDGIRFIVGDRKGNLYVYDKHSFNPVQTFKKAHNYLGVTNLVFNNGKVYSLGRNSVMKEYVIDECLNPVFSDKLPFTWLTKYLPYHDLILAFSGANFIVWSVSKRCCMLKYNCQGGHRSWDFSVNKFVFLRDKMINIIAYDLPSITPTTIVESYHSWEINAAKIVRSLIISGGEDTTLRILNNWKYLKTLKSHLSSVRTLEVCLIRSEKDKEVYYIVSGGGRAQIILWELHLHLKNENIFGVDCFQRHSYYECLDPNESETRIMDVALHKLKNSSEELLLFAACSDGTIKYFLIHSKKLLLINNIKYNLKCILTIKIFEFDNKLIMVTAATDGLLNFWDVSPSLTKVNLDYLKPFYSLKLHKSGINNLSMKHIHKEKYLFVTGGDDSSINLALMHFLSKPENGIVAENLASVKLEGYHCTQVNGTFINERYIVTSSTDQKIVVFEWNLNNELHCEYVKSYYSCVSDLQGLDVMEKNNSFHVLLYGKGAELLEIKPYS